MVVSYMGKEQTFRRIMLFLIVLFIAIFSYIVVADRQAPISSEGRVHGLVVQVASEVIGRVTKVRVVNNQRVKKGDILFELDQEPYLIALKDARLSLESAEEELLSLQTQKDVLLAGIRQARAHFDNAKREFIRAQELERRNLTSKSEFDAAERLYLMAAAGLEAEKQSLRSIKILLGQDGNTTIQLKVAQNRLNKVALDLENTKIRASVNGVVTNLRLDVGTMASVQVPLLSIVSTDSLWIAADFREKSVSRISKGSYAYVTFDAYPGKVFSYSVESRDKGVMSAQYMPNGTLSQIEVNNRWVRDAQRARINLANDKPLPDALFVGSRATLTLYVEEKSFWQKLAWIQIKVVSWLHFVY